MATLVRLWQYANADERFVTPAGIVTLISPEELNTPARDVIPFGMTTLVRLVQPETIELPKVVTLFGIVKLVRLSQYAKAQAPTLVTPDGMFAAVRLMQPIKAKSSILLRLSGNATFERPTHLTNASCA